MDHRFKSYIVHHFQKTNKNPFRFSGFESPEFWMADLEERENIRDISTEKEP